MKTKIKVAFASGSDELNCRLVERMRAIFPELPLWVVSEFPPEDGDLKWVPYYVNRGFYENFSRCRAALGDRSIRLAGVILEPGLPFRRMRLMALMLSPIGFLAFNENLDDFMLRPRCLPAIARHVAWRAKNFVRWIFRTARWANWRLVRWYAVARVAAWFRVGRARTSGWTGLEACPTGVSVIIPSRDGRELLAAQLPGIVRELGGFPSEIVVVDNGSGDGTAGWLGGAYPQIRVEISPEPLSFARAINRGLRVAAYSHVCLLNNDMLLEPGFFTALVGAFERAPGLFCATAQIRFPAGARREETGKTVFGAPGPEDFPIRCDEPLPGEDLSYVLYGSGGCSLYDARKLAALGGVDEAYTPVYVEDLDLGYRAWQRGWPSVYVAGAVVEHRHRATASRYYNDRQLDAILETNYLRFLWRAVADGRLFRRLWGLALRRLKARGRTVRLRDVWGPQTGRRVGPAGSEETILALNGGDVAVFPGRAASGKPRVLIATPYLPFPLSHGGAVRIYNLMRRAAAEFDQAMVAFTDRLGPPAPELLDLCTEVVLVRRSGSHSPPSSGRPLMVEEFDSPAFRAALRQTVLRWRPAIAQLEFTQMAQYAADCAPARTILVEHDITFDLYEQMLSLGDDWELRQQLALWRHFETGAWRNVSRVVTMSEKDRKRVTARAVAIPNGVDLERYHPAAREPEPRRLLFIGSFAHLPNLLALEFFLERVRPLLGETTLHVIAGARPEYFLARWRDRVRVDLPSAGVEMEGFVADPRPAYERAAVAIAPLVVSAGTNIKVLEAMAMAKAVVSTAAGVNGLDDLVAGEDFLLAGTPAEMAAAIEGLLGDPGKRRAIGAAARRRVERDYGWDVIARRQERLYREILGAPTPI